MVKHILDPIIQDVLQADELVRFLQAHQTQEDLRLYTTPCAACGRRPNVAYVSIGEHRGGIRRWLQQCFHHPLYQIPPSQKHHTAENDTWCQSVRSY